MKINWKFFYKNLYVGLLMNVCVFAYDWCEREAWRVRPYGGGGENSLNLPLSRPLSLSFFLATMATILMHLKCRLRWLLMIYIENILLHTRVIFVRENSILPDSPMLLRLESFGTRFFFQLPTTQNIVMPRLGWRNGLTSSSQALLTILIYIIVILNH